VTLHVWLLLVPEQAAQPRLEKAVRRIARKNAIRKKDRSYAIVILPASSRPNLGRGLLDWTHRDPLQKVFWKSVAASVSHAELKKQ
jgi:hypothetical protein